jgi:hypothetical protein
MPNYTARQILKHPKLIANYQEAKSPELEADS